MSDSIVKVQDNPVIETIMARRSIRKYKPEAVERDKMETILNCGIHAPNGMNKQSWEVRVVDNQDFINELTEIFKKENPKAAERAGFKNMFNNAPTVAFIAYDPRYDMSQIDCGLLGANMYNPQNEMFRLLGTKRSFSQNETFFFSHPYPPTLPFSA